MRPALALAACVLACAPDGTGDDATGDDPTGTTAADIPEPAFLNPAVGEFTVDTNQRVPEEFLVERVIPGLTRVLLDGYSLGTFGPDSLFGSLTEDDLSLAVHGALVAGRHTLQLSNPSPDGPLGSVTLTMEIAVPSVAQRPVWRAERTATDLTGAALLATGAGADRLLALLATGDPDPVLQLLRPAPDGWLVGDPLPVPLPGHVPSAMSLAPAVTAVAADERIRVAFSAGQPGAAIVVRDVHLGDAPQLADPVTAFDLSTALADEQVEWAAFGRPFVLGDTLVAELLATADTELPHPGDRRLVASFWRGDDAGWTPPARVSTPSPTDLDALGPALVVPTLARGPADVLSVRIGGAFSGLLAAADDGAVTITTPTNTAPFALSGDLELVTFVGDFGGRTVASLDEHGRVAMTFLQTSGDTAARGASPVASTLPGAAPTGAPAPGLSLGFAFVLVPYGDAAPVHAVLTDSREVVATPLTDPEPIHCDAVALAAVPAGDDPDDPALPFACLSHGALSVGRLIAAPAGE